MARRRRQPASPRPVSEPTQGSLLVAQNQSRVDFLAGLFTGWRYGEKARKAEREEAYTLAREVAYLIESMPERRPSDD